MTRTRSIRGQLVGALAAGLAVAVVVATIATYLRAKDEANGIFDYQLRQMAASLTGIPLAAGGPPGAAPGADALVVQVWDGNGVQVYLSEPQRQLPQYAQLGFNTVDTGSGAWRVFSTLAGGQVIQVAQPMSVRRELAASMALRTILPLVAVVPFLALVVWVSIARGLAPLTRVTAALGQRSSRSLDPLPEAGLPAEVEPLVAALNGLLGRLDRALASQRAFIADAAHELRTPLTAVHLQAQLVERADTDADRHAALATLTRGLLRVTHLVEQLLALAREEPDVAVRPFAPVDLAALARSVVGEYAPIASVSKHDLGLERFDTAVVDGDGDGLRTLLSNLIDNALRYTPAGGRVDVAVLRRGADVALSVRDSGPGIPAAERARVFDRFYRAPSATTTDLAGSGLGLAIVRRVADRHGAEISLGPGIVDGAREGLGVTVVFPAAPPSQATAAG
ncbi:MAG: ATP-binding protein [Betaproteobacteria bacterium]